LKHCLDKKWRRRLFYVRNGSTISHDTLRQRVAMHWLLFKSCGSDPSKSGISHFDWPGSPAVGNGHIRTHVVATPGDRSTKQATCAIRKQTTGAGLLSDSR